MNNYLIIFLVILITGCNSKQIKQDEILGSSFAENSLSSCSEKYNYNMPNSNIYLNLNKGHVYSILESSSISTSYLNGELIKNTNIPTKEIMVELVREEIIKGNRSGRQVMGNYSQGFRTHREGVYFTASFTLGTSGYYYNYLIKDNKSGYYLFIAIEKDQTEKLSDDTTIKMIDTFSDLCFKI